MKKLLMALFLTIALACWLPARVANAVAPITYMTGYVTHDGKPVVGAAVIPSCGRYFADADYTDETGAYLTSLPTSECGWGSTVELLAVTETSYGTAEGVAEKITSKLNIALTDIVIK